MLHPSEDASRVAVAIATYKRAARLLRLLEALARLDRPPGQTGSLVVAVVDNDADGSSRAVVEEFAAAGQGHRVELRYAVEARPGVASARNTAVHLLRDHDFVAFIDDDMLPADNWLRALMAAQERDRADVVGGPVVPLYADETPSWVVRGGFFEPRRLSSGDRIRQAGMGNLLLRLAVLGDEPAPLDPEFGLGGAEDTLLCLRLHRDGRRLVWESEAVAFEDVPADRATMRWLVRRALRTENSGALCELKLASQADAGRLRRRLVIEGLRMSASGVVAGPVLGGVWSRVNWVRAFRLVARGVGRVTAAAGWRYLEYGRDGQRWVRVPVGTNNDQ